MVCLILSQKHVLVVIFFILMLNESTEYIYVYLGARICYLGTSPRWPP